MSRSRSAPTRRAALVARRPPPLTDRRGQVVPLLAVLLVMAGVCGVGLVHLGAAASRRAAAQAAADAAALAGAAAGPEAAERVAAANGARLEGYRAEGVDVVVTVRRADVTASARARWAPGGPAG